MTPDQQKRLIQQYIADRRKGKILCPVLDHRLDPIRVTLSYGVRGSLWITGHHTGEDHACDVGSYAVATSWGHVVGVGWSGEPLGWGPYYGNQVIIRTASGKYDYAFCHLSKVLVHLGQKVQPGQLVGLSGATGHVTGPHVHFEARPAGGRYGSDVNPLRVKQKGH